MVMEFSNVPLTTYYHGLFRVSKKFVIGEKLCASAKKSEIMSDTELKVANIQCILEVNRSSLNSPFLIKKSVNELIRGLRQHYVNRNVNIMLVANGDFLMCNCSPASRVSEC